MEKNNLDKSDLLFLYDLEIKRENEIRDKWRKTMNFYLTTILTLLSAVILLVEFYKDSKMFKIILIFVGILIIALSIIALLHFKLDYKYQMEILSIQMKLEDILGLNDVNNPLLKNRWEGEALLPASYSKNNFKSSEDFVKAMCGMKKINFYEVLYYIFAFMGIGIIILGFIYKVDIEQENVRMFFNYKIASW